jgi:hypothetical protein
LRSRLTILAALLSGCASPVLVVDVQNPQGLPIAHEHVVVDWFGPNGETRSGTHDFDVSGNLGTFSISLSSVSGGRLRVSVEVQDVTSTEVGRGSATVALDGRSRYDLTLRATRLLGGQESTLLAGIPGGNGDRAGATGPDPTLPGRLDHPIAFTSHGHSGMAGSVGFVLERCGAIKKIHAVGGSSIEVQPFLPCGRKLAPGSQPPNGKVSDLSLDDPTAMVSDPYNGSLYIADGARILQIPFAMLDVDASQLSYVDFAAASGQPPQHAADLALAPYRDSATTQATPYTELLVADDKANVVWSFPIPGGTPVIAAGQLGACPTPPLDDAEVAHPPAMSGMMWQPGPYLQPTQAHLCRPTGLETGAIAGPGSDPVFFVIDKGNGSVRMVAPNGLATGSPGITTLFDGFPNLNALGYRYLKPNSVLAGVEIGGMFFWNGDQLVRFIEYMNPVVEGLGLTGMIGTGATPGYTESFNMLNAISAVSAGGESTVQFDGVRHTYRVSDQEASDALVGKSFFLFVQEGNAVVSRVDTDLNVAPWYGAGPHRGNDVIGAKPAANAVFSQPVGLAWNGLSDAFVADHDNHAIARLTYDGTNLPLSGVKVDPLAGCPGTPGRVDGPAATALLRNPTQVAWDAKGAVLYVLDGDGTAVRNLSFDANGTPTEIHTLFADDTSDGPACGTDGGVQDGGMGAPGLLGSSSSMAFDATHRTLFLAHADAPDVLRLDLDGSSPQLLPLPSGFAAGAQLAVVDATLWALDPNGRLAAIDLLGSAASEARAVSDLAPGGNVTAFGTDGEWLYVADDSSRVWRVDPHDAVPAVTPLMGDGQHGLKVGPQPGFNRVGGFGYDAARGVLLISDSAENSVVAIQ